MPQELIEAHPRKDTQGCEQDSMAAHSESVWGRMCRAFAELSIQSSFCRGQKRQEDGTPLGN